MPHTLRAHTCRSTQRLQSASAPLPPGLASTLPLVSSAVVGLSALFPGSALAVAGEPVDACSPRVWILKAREDASCLRNGEHFVPASLSALEPGYTIQRLYSCEDQAALNSRLLSANANGLEPYYLLEFQGEHPPTEAPAVLGRASRVEFSCGVAGLSDSQYGSSATTIPTQPEHHSVLTGSADAVEGLTRRLCDSGDCAASNVSRPRVAVLDSGISPVVVPEVADEGWSALTGSGLPWLTDDHGHGSAVARLIADATGSLADLVSIQVLDGGGRGLQHQVAQGLVAAAGTFKADVLNLSLGWRRDDAVPEGSMPEYFQVALELMRFAPIQVIAAAGNRCGENESECEAFYPAALAPTLSAGGMSESNQASPQSVKFNTHLFAPSEGVCARVPTDNGLSARPARIGGTSMASAQVTGAYALLLAYRMAEAGVYRASQLSPSIREELVQALETDEFLDGYRLNLCTAMENLGIETGYCTAWEDVQGLDSLVSACGARDISTQITLDSLEDLKSFEYGELEVFALPGSELAVETIPPLDSEGEGAWCSGLWSAPTNPVCTSCDYCSNLTGNTVTVRVSGLQPDLTQFQLKVVTVEDRRIYFPLSGGSSALTSGLAIQLPGELSQDRVRELWLMGAPADYSVWYASPLARTGTCP